MKNMFRVCATERLFIPDMFPSLDRAIYIDTDLIFLRCGVYMYYVLRCVCVRYFSWAFFQGYDLLA